MQSTQIKLSTTTNGIVGRLFFQNLLSQHLLVAILKKNLTFESFFTTTYIIRNNHPTSHLLEAAIKKKIHNQPEKLIQRNVGKKIPATRRQMFSGVPDALTQTYYKARNLLNKKTNWRPKWQKKLASPSKNKTKTKHKSPKYRKKIQL